ncbi:hypothetical protein J2Y64_004422 [Aeromonas salmonicida]|nr:hypothetical protein [Aeromonas salmonicida]
MDTPAFQHLLSLFPLLTLRQRRVAQQELTAPHAITSLNTQFVQILLLSDGIGFIAALASAAVLALLLSIVTTSGSP